MAYTPLPETPSSLSDWLRVVVSSCVKAGRHLYKRVASRWVVYACLAGVLELLLNGMIVIAIVGGMNIGLFVLGDLSLAKDGESLRMETWVHPLDSSPLLLMCQQALLYCFLHLSEWKGVPTLPIPLFCDPGDGIWAFGRALWRGGWTDVVAVHRRSAFVIGFLLPISHLIGHTGLHVAFDPSILHPSDSALFGHRYHGYAFLCSFVGGLVMMGPRQLARHPEQWTLFWTWIQEWWMDYTRVLAAIVVVQGPSQAVRTLWAWRLQPLAYFLVPLYMGTVGVVLKKRCQTCLSWVGDVLSIDIRAWLQQTPLGEGLAFFLVFMVYIVGLHLPFRAWMWMTKIGPTGWGEASIVTASLALDIFLVTCRGSTSLCAAWTTGHCDVVVPTLKRWILRSPAPRPLLWFVFLCAWWGVTSTVVVVIAYVMYIYIIAIPWGLPGILSLVREFVHPPNPQNRYSGIWGPLPPAITTDHSAQWMFSTLYYGLFLPLMCYGVVFMFLIALEAVVIALNYRKIRVPIGSTLAHWPPEWTKRLRGFFVVAWCGIATLMLIDFTVRVMINGDTHGRPLRKTNWFQPGEIISQSAMFFLGFETFDHFPPWFRATSIQEQAWSNLRLILLLFTPPSILYGAGGVVGGVVGGFVNPPNPKRSDHLVSDSQVGLGLWGVLQIPPSVSLEMSFLVWWSILIVYVYSYIVYSCIRNMIGRMYRSYWMTSRVLDHPMHQRTEVADVRERVFIE